MTIDNRRKSEWDMANRVYWAILAILQTIMTVELAALLFGKQWLNGVLVLAIMALTLAPAVLGPRLPVRIPTEFQILTLVFVFAALFLGEMRNYYNRFWWWDIALHSSSGLLFGVLGFLLVYVLNENERVALQMRPRFVALFAFVLAIAVGTLWEIFEFGMDQAFGMQMQKPSLGDPSGLMDTMWDLIVNAISALAISAFGWWYMVRDERSFIENWIDKFNRHNRQLFRRGKAPRARSTRHVRRLKRGA
jgi:hypothetical protein